MTCDDWQQSKQNKKTEHIFFCLYSSIKSGYNCCPKHTIVLIFQLEDTRTTDRKQTFLSYIVEIVQKKFPDLHDFPEELYLDGATTG